MSVPWHPSTYFITGATGLVGSAIVEYLHNLNKGVICLVRKESSPEVIDWLASLGVKIVFGDLLEPKTYRVYLAVSDVVVHTAALVQSTDEELNQRFNVQATRMLVTAMVKFGIRRLIYISTAGVYGTYAQDPIKEDHPFHPKSAYTRSKVDAEKILRDAVGDDLFLTIIRPPFIVGHRDRHVIPTLFKMFPARVMFKVWRHDPSIGFVYASDVASLVYLSASQRTTSHVAYNVQSFQLRYTSLLDLLSNARQQRTFKLRIPYTLLVSIAWIVDQIGKLRSIEPSLRDGLKMFKDGWLLSTELATGELDWAIHNATSEQFQVLLQQYVNIPDDASSDMQIEPPVDPILA